MWRGQEPALLRHRCLRYRWAIAVIGTVGFGIIGDTTTTMRLCPQFSFRVKVGGLKSARI